MPKFLKDKITIWITAVLCILFFIMGVVSFFYQKSVIYSREREALKNLAKVLEATVSNRWVREGKSGIEDSLKVFSKTLRNFVVAVTDRKGRVEFATISKLVGKSIDTNKLDKEKLEELLGYRIIGILQPVKDEEGRVLGFLSLVEDFGVVAKAISKATTIIVILFLIGLLLIFLAVRFFSARLLRPINRFVSVFEEIAEGKFPKEIEKSAEQEIRKLSDALNKVVSFWKDTLSEIDRAGKKISETSHQFVNITHQMSEVIQQISAAMAQLSKGVTDQTVKVENVSKIMGEVNTSLREVGDKAKNTADVSASAASQVNLSGEKIPTLSEKVDKVFDTVNKNVEVMRTLEERSQQIGEITATITSIADQTNLLSLNAAIEAARAGEAGRGFGVVADEIRKLAENSAQSASRIGGLIKNIQEDVGKAISSIEIGSKEVTEGRNVVIEIKDALKRIISSVNKANTMAQQIVKVISEQLARTEEGVKAVEEVASIIEGTSAGVEEASASIQEQTASMEEMASSAQQLSELAKSVEELMKRFKFEEN
ncbi:MAG: hypothetical protein DRP72_02235 [Candidatus Omnitrophota bacterium]|nr:MAG: hypothetical protein DRP72_02235 [Candidatus Omnitrophota bacterium]